uniref:Ovarian jelly-peptide 3 n=1 Tax=Sepia officinalis TaxID=6610 RepID=OJP3_SEPOF|nr:RecName: Full=Ovarian jelly-peptide 3; Short=OJP3; Contains: RecName: Full=Ovarian jelly-peptide 2; Short=OJP2 [Sepia officinalis]
DEVKIVLD